MPFPEQHRYRSADTTHSAPEAAPASLQDTLARLEQAVGAIHDSDSFRRYLDVQSRFHHYSAGNTLLILAQRPDATHVAGFATWRALGRTVRRGEKGIRILVPIRRRREADAEDDPPLYFRSGSVFDIAQTEGEPLPQIEVPVLAGEEGQAVYGRLHTLAHAEGLSIEHATGDLDEHTMGYYQPGLKRIVVREAAPLQMAKTLAHELAHHFSAAKSSSPENETIAEACAYVVCAHFGLDTGERSFPYVATWSRDPKILKGVMATIQQVSAAMIDQLEAAAPPGEAAGKE